MKKEVMLPYETCIQRFGSLQIYKRKRVSAVIIDETVIQIGNRRFWLWFCIEPANNFVLVIYIFRRENNCNSNFYSYK